DKGLAIAKQLKVGRFILKIHRDGSVFAGLASCIVHSSSSGQMVGAADDPKWRNTCTIARRSRRAEVPPHEIRWNVVRVTSCCGLSPGAMTTRDWIASSFPVIETFFPAAYASWIWSNDPSSQSTTTKRRPTLQR